MNTINNDRMTKIISVVLSVIFGVLVVSLVANAVTTISTNIATDGNATITGTLGVTGASTLTGLTSMIQASSTRFSVHDKAYFGGSATSTINSSGDLFVVGSSTLQAFTFVTATGTSATTTNSFSTTASSTNLASASAVVGTLTSPGTITSSSKSAGIGYATGAGCAVTQDTNRTTGVTCTGVSGAITTHNASLAAEATAKFTVTNTSVAVGDVVVVSQRSGSDGGGTLVEVTTVAAGSFQIAVHNGNVAAGTAETGAIIINFAVIKAVSN